MSTAKKLIDTLMEDIKGSGEKASPSYMKLIEFFPLQPIASKSQHQLSLKIIEKLISFQNDSSSADEGIELYLKTLAELVGDYENKQYGTPDISGAEMLAYLMELKGLNQSDLSNDLGGQSVVSKILNGTRELNLRQIKALAKRFKVPPVVFIK